MLALQIVAVLVLGLMCGSELNVAVFSHPALNRQPLEAHIAVRSSLARVLGRVMPFWMASSTLLNLLLILPFQHLNNSAWRLDAAALAIQIFAVLFSIIAPVPINNLIGGWTPTSLPGDWQEQEHRWDVYHWLRTGGLLLAFVLLTLSLCSRCQLTARRCGSAE